VPLVYGWMVPIPPSSCIRSHRMVAVRTAWPRMPCVRIAYMHTHAKPLRADEPCTQGLPVGQPQIAVFRRSTATRSLRWPAPGRQAIAIRCTHCVSCTLAISLCLLSTRARGPQWPHCTHIALVYSILYMQWPHSVRNGVQEVYVSA